VNARPADELYLRLSHPAPVPLNVQLRCAAGELIALVGPSGSGKTTVMPIEEIGADAQAASQPQAAGQKVGRRGGCAV
jgi:ABC-type lipoprotein export system ATPase subunit